MALEGWHTLVRERLLVNGWLFPAEIVDFCSLLRLQMEIKGVDGHGGFRTGAAVNWHLHRFRKGSTIAHTSAGNPL
jgi:hypothetical protein